MIGLGVRMHICVCVQGSGGEPPVFSYLHVCNWTELGSLLMSLKAALPQLCTHIHTGFQ